MEREEKKTIERVRKAMPPGIARKLWVKSAGRCEYCNIILWRDSLTQKDMNKAYISHIIAASEKGPRGDKNLSPLLEIKESNLLLLCDECHNRIDESQKEEHSVEMLLNIKKEHEERIEILTDIKYNKRSQIILYRANIGEHSPQLNYEIARDALVNSGYFPNSHRAISLSLSESPFKDKDDAFWQIESSNLETKFNEYVKPLFRENSLPHISLFGFAPMPLLIKLGTLLHDIQNVRLYQPHRNPTSWEWQTESNPFEFSVLKPDKVFQKVALNISISGTITNERIHSVLGEDCSIYTLTVAEPFNNLLRSYEQMKNFQPNVQKLLNEIKAKHSQVNTIHIFPAMPCALAIEFGRVRMPKADLPLIIYDQITPNKPFVKTLKIE